MSILEKRRLKKKIRKKRINQIFIGKGGDCLKKDKIQDVYSLKSRTY